MMKALKVSLALVCLISASITYASTYLNGVIREGSTFIAADTLVNTRPIDFKFPRQEYAVQIVFISNLSYNDTLKNNERKIDPSQIQSIYANGTLRLITFDPITKIYKFSLSISPVNLQKQHDNPATTGSILFPKNQPDCIMTGRITQKDGAPYLENLTAPENDCQLHVKITKNNYQEYMSLTTRYEIPVVVAIDS